jgi:catechol 2,3-dioxygenase-like lactoylglutathione lyase family enzyme
MQPTFRLSRVSVIMLGVSDLDQSLAFYRDKLGLSVKMQLAELALLEAGPITLGLSQGLARAVPQKAGAMEIVFAVENVRAAHTALTTQGVTFVREPTQVTPTDWAAHFRDPDGHLFSVFGPEGQP